MTPHITIEQANFLWHWDVNLQMTRVNKTIDEYNKMLAERAASNKPSEKPEPTIETFGTIQEVNGKIMFKYFVFNGAGTSDDAVTALAKAVIKRLQGQFCHD